MRQPEYNSNKGLAFFRLGGLSPVFQDNLKAPANKGLWAFIFPYFDYWFLSGHFSQNKFPKKEVKKHLQPKPRKFYAKGEIFTLINVPGSEKYNQWNLTTDKDLYNYLPKLFAKDIKYMQNLNRNNYNNYKFEIIRNPYCGKGFISTDHMEVFIPNWTKIS